MIFCNTVRYEGREGIWYVTREKDGFVDVTIDTENGEHHLEFSPALFMTLIEAFKDIAAGKEYKGAVSGECHSVKPDVSLHIDEEEVGIGFEDKEDCNPVEENWPTIVICNKNLELRLGLGPDQAKNLMECCRRIIALGAAAEDYAQGIIKDA